MKNIFFTSLTVIIFCGCNNEDFIQNQSEKHITFSTEGLQLDYLGIVDGNGMLNLSLMVNDNEKKKNFDMQIDVSSVGYRLNISNTLQNASKKLIGEVTKENAKLLSDSIRKLIKDYDNPNDFKKEEFHGLYYFHSVFRAIYRYHSLNETRVDSIIINPIQITSYNGYITGLTPYMATEDIIIDVPHFKKYLKNYTLNRLTKEDINYIVQMVGDRQLMSLKDYQDVVHKPLEVENSSNGKTECWLLCGGDCGCCGNYEGQCYYAHPICYIHDYFCDEWGWGCFSGCVQGEC